MTAPSAPRDEAGERGGKQGGGITSEQVPLAGESHRQVLTGSSAELLMCLITLQRGFPFKISAGERDWSLGSDRGAELCRVYFPAETRTSQSARVTSHSSEFKSTYLELDD